MISEIWMICLHDPLMLPHFTAGHIFSRAGLYHSEISSLYLLKNNQTSLFNAIKQQEQKMLTINIRDYWCIGIHIIACMTQWYLEHLISILVFAFLFLRETWPIYYQYSTLEHFLVSFIIIIMQKLLFISYVITKERKAKCQYSTLE